MLDVYDLATGFHPYFSSDVRDLLGYTADEIGKMEDEFSVLVCPEDLPRLGENIERLKRLKDGEINEFECRVRRGDGELRWVMARSMVFARNGRGEVQQVVNATLDITERKRAEEALRRAHDELEGRVAKRTRQLSASNEELLKEIGERKRAEEALRESEARFRSYFELGLIGMAITSPTKGILEANDELCRTLGYEREELLQMTWAELTHPDDLAADGAKFELVIAGVMDGYMLDKRWIRKDGCVIDTIMSAKCLRRADGSVDYCVGLILETTERRRAEEERTQILQRLIGVQEEERRRIAREMHDEFGQQLTALILQLGMLKGDCGNGQEVRARLESLEASARQLDREVEFLVWKLRPTALDDLGLRAALERHARNWSATFGVPCEVHVRGMGRERLAPEGETTLYRIAQEALNNVAKYARASNVGVVLARDDGQVSLIVEDDGVGFEVEKTQGGKGGGFGLIGMRERAALVGGTVEVESRSGGGTTVYVRIPARETTVEERAE
jgi:PAS domain S-box-containing protein